MTYFDYERLFSGSERNDQHVQLIESRSEVEGKCKFFIFRIFFLFLTFLNLTFSYYANTSLELTNVRFIGKSKLRDFRRNRNPRRRWGRLFQWSSSIWPGEPSFRLVFVEFLKCFPSLIRFRTIDASKSTPSLASRPKPSVHRWANKINLNF